MADYPIKYRDDQPRRNALVEYVNALSTEQKVEHFFALDALAIPPVDFGGLMMTLNERYEVHRTRVPGIADDLIYVFDTVESGITIIGYVTPRIDHAAIAADAAKAFGSAE